MFPETKKTLKAQNTRNPTKSLQNANKTRKILKNLKALFSCYFNVCSINSSTKRTSKKVLERWSESLFGIQSSERSESPLICTFLCVICDTDDVIQNLATHKGTRVRQFIKWMVYLAAIGLLLTNTGELDKLSQKGGSNDGYACRFGYLFNFQVM